MAQHAKQCQSGKGADLARLFESQFQLGSTLIESVNPSF
jgi:hypothetical protein